MRCLHPCPGIAQTVNNRAQAQHQLTEGNENADCLDYL